MKLTSLKLTPKEAKMSILNRRCLLAGVTALPLVAIHTRGARAADFNLKMANNSPVSHPQSIRQQEAIGRIKQATGGRVDIQLFPNNQLGSDTDMLSQLRTALVVAEFSAGPTAMDMDRQPGNCVESYLSVQWSDRSVQGADGRQSHTG